MIAFDMYRRRLAARCYDWRERHDRDHGDRLRKDRVFGRREKRAARRDQMREELSW